MKRDEIEEAPDASPRLHLVHALQADLVGPSRNLEAGVQIDDPAFARALERQWNNLVEAGVVVE